MKKLYSLLLALFIILPSTAKTYCVLAGVSNYGKASMMLYTATDDVKKMRAYFASKNALCETYTSSKATSVNILKSIGKLQRCCKPDDDVVFYFSGHGACNLLLTYDIINSIYYSTLIEELRKINCRKIFVYLDACYSGTVYTTLNSEGEEFQNTDLEKNIGNNEKFIIFTASRNNEVANELKTSYGGFFTNALLSGLSGAADFDGNKEITVQELHKHIWENVTVQISRQHPNLITNEKNMDVVVSTISE